MTPSQLDRRAKRFLRITDELLAGVHASPSLPCDVELLVRQAARDLQNAAARLAMQRDIERGTHG